MRKEQKLTQREIKQALNYCPMTGEFTWNEGFIPAKSRGRVSAGWFNKAGYRSMSINGVQVAAHRVAWIYMTGEWPEHTVDHLDLNPSNNKWENLRHATVSQNLGNINRYKHNTSGFKGVFWCKDKRLFRAVITVEGKKIPLGYFRDPAKGGEAYKAAAEKYRGEFARA